MEAHSDVCFASCASHTSPLYILFTCTQSLLYFIMVKAVVCESL